MWLGNFFMHAVIQLRSLDRPLSLKKLKIIVECEKNNRLWWINFLRLKSYYFYCRPKLMHYLVFLMINEYIYWILLVNVWMERNSWQQQSLFRSYSTREQHLGVLATFGLPYSKKWANWDWKYLTSLYQDRIGPLLACQSWACLDRA